jgi:hypothetical protein
MDRNEPVGICTGCIQGTTFRLRGHGPVRPGYLSYKLSSRDLVEMMRERGIALAHTTILRWVQRYVPVFEKQWSQYARPVGGSWRCDETFHEMPGDSQTILSCAVTNVLCFRRSVLYCSDFL